MTPRPLAFPRRFTPARATTLWLACALLLLGCARGAGGSDDSLELTGLIEGQGATLSAELGGRVAERLVREGETVSPGQPLLRLDDPLLAAQRAEAEAQLRIARAAGEVVSAGTRLGERESALAAVAGAQAAYDGALGAWRDAIQARDNPQQLQGRITAVRAELAIAAYRVEEARLTLQAAELERNQTQEGSDARRVADARVRAQTAAVAAAGAERDGLALQLDRLLAIQEQPLAAQAQVDAALGEYLIAAAELRLAEARLAELEAGPRPEELAVAAARVRQAQAALAVLTTQEELMTVRAPQVGANVVTELLVEEGEVVTAGAPLLTLARLDPVYLTLYVPTDHVGRLRLGDTISVRVEGLPGRAFPGKIVYIAPRAEFTPTSLQTREERVRAVFPVKLRLPNPGGAVKPGAPADALIP